MLRDSFVRAISISVYGCVVKKKKKREREKERKEKEKRKIKRSGLYKRVIRKGEGGR